LIPSIARAIVMESPKARAEIEALADQSAIRNRRSKFPVN